MGIFRSIIFNYFYLNDVNVTTDANNPNIDAVVYINVDVFGSIRSRLDTVVYNKETVQVQTAIEVMAVSAKDRTLVMQPQTGAYEATYDEKYIVWIGPLNKKKNRITHQEMDDGLLIDFEDIAAAKAERDKGKKQSFMSEQEANDEEIKRLESEYLQLAQVKAQEKRIRQLKRRIQALQNDEELELLLESEPREGETLKKP